MENNTATGVYFCVTEEEYENVIQELIKLLDH